MVRRRQKVFDAIIGQLRSYEIPIQPMEEWHCKEHRSSAPKRSVTLFDGFSMIWNMLQDIKVHYEIVSFVSTTQGRHIFVAYSQSREIVVHTWLFIRPEVFARLKLVIFRCKDTVKWCNAFEHQASRWLERLAHRPPGRGCKARSAIGPATANHAFK